MGRNQQPKGGRYARNKGTQPHAGSKGGQVRSKTAGAAAALGRGVPQQSTALSGIAGLPGTAQQSPLGSLFGSAGTGPLAGVAGLAEGLSIASGGSGPAHLHDDYNMTAILPFRYLIILSWLIEHITTTALLG